jgi:hypothetical protein
MGERFGNKQQVHNGRRGRYIGNIIDIIDKRLLSELADGPASGFAKDSSDFSPGTFQVAVQRHGAHELPVLKKAFALGQFRESVSIGSVRVRLARFPTPDRALHGAEPGPKLRQAALPSQLFDQAWCPPHFLLSHCGTSSSPQRVVISAVYQMSTHKTSAPSTTQKPRLKAELGTHISKPRLKAELRLTTQNPA